MRGSEPTLTDRRVRIDGALEYQLFQVGLEDAQNDEQKDEEKD